MTAHSENPGGASVRLMLPLLVMLLAFLIKLGFSVNAWFIMPPGRDPRIGQTLSVYAWNLLLIAAIWILSRRSSSKPKIAAMSVLLAMVALAGFSGADAIVKVLDAGSVPWRAWTWQTRAIFGANLLIGASAVWGVLCVKPWRLLHRPDELESPATRKARRLFGLGGLVGILAIVALALGTHDADGNPVWSNSQNVSFRFAILAIVIWMVSMALSWWWYRSADEHDRRSNDVGFLAGGGLFMAVTPIWWILARAGVLPPPDAMILWYATIVAMGIGWAWHRNR